MNWWNTNRHWPNWNALRGCRYERPRLQRTNDSRQNDTIAALFGLRWLASITLTVVASVLWWRLSHAGAMSQPANSSATAAAMQDMSANVSDSEHSSTAEMQGANVVDSSACSNSAYAATNAEHRHCVGKG